MPDKKVDDIIIRSSFLKTYLLDLIAISVCSFFFIVMWLTTPPLHHDSQYHLAVTRMFYDTGKIVLQDTLQYQPVGRPHLYPPFTHVFMAGLLVLLDGDILLLARLATASIWPLLLMSIWLVGKTLKGSQTGFFALMLASSIGGMFNLASMIMPTTICLVFQNFLLITYVKQQNNKKLIIPSLILFTLICYSHIAFPLITALSLLFYAIVNFWKTRRLHVLVGHLGVLVGGLLLYTPWLLHIVNNLSSFSQNEFKIDFFIDISLPYLIAILAIPTVLRIVRDLFRTDQIDLTNDVEAVVDIIFLAPLVGLVLMTPYGHRFWPYFTFYLSLLAAITIVDSRKILSKADKKPLSSSGLLYHGFIGIVVVSSLTVYPAYEQGFVLAVPHYSNIPRKSWINPSPLMVSLDYLAHSGFDHQLDPDVQNVSAWISTNLEKNTLIHLININSMEACSIIFLTGNPVTSGQWGETITQEMTQRLQSYLKHANGFFLVRDYENIPPGALIRETFPNNLILAYRP